MTTTWTAVEERIVWTASEDPSYQFQTLRPTTVTLESGGGGGGAVDSVNGETGTVVLDATDVGADPAGTASSAVSAHTAASDPHGDRAYAAGLVDDLSGVTNAATARSNLGLGNVDNTSDVNKPVSTAQQTALDGKAASSHSHAVGDVTGLDEQVRDVVGAALVAGSGVTVTVNDAGDTITVAATGTFDEGNTILLTQVFGG